MLHIIHARTQTHTNQKKKYLFYASSRKRNFHIKYICCDGTHVLMLLHEVFGIRICKSINKCQRNERVYVLTR